MGMGHGVLILVMVLLATLAAKADETPMVPVGLDAYRMWERWPYQRIGVRAYMRSTYDRTGGNRSADASHFLYQLADDFSVTLDTVGPGILYFARYNHWHGSPWHYEVDGGDHIVRESSTADPTKPLEGSVFLPEKLFPNPLTWTWATTKGADLMWVPIPFEDSFRMAYTRTRYGTGYYLYHLFDPGANLSQPIKSWDGKTPPSKDVLDLISRSGNDPDPVTRYAGTSRTTSIPKGKTLTLIELTGPSMIRELQFSAPKEHALALSDVRLKITWDGREHPSVDAPLALFFGAGTFYNRDDNEYLVKGFPMNVRFDAERIHMACYFPMPFFKSAKIELAGIESADILDVRWKVRFEPYSDPPNHVGYFHATYGDHPTPELGRDMVFLDTTKVEGGGDWSGSFVGTSFIFTHRGVLNTLEGDPRFFFDDSRTPQAQGTGSEEWGGGGDYWGGRTMTLPLAGHPVGARKPEEAKCPEDLIHSEYRFLLADLFPFGKNARIQFEHGALNDSKEHYKSVVYWYGLPSASLIKTDEMDIGDMESERAHEYSSPDTSAPVEVTSRYEWGPDTLDGKEIYPAETDIGRVTKGTSEFTLKLVPENKGVLLRRKLDYSYPNQRAEVYVSEFGKSDWMRAGTWYLAGSNTCVYSDAKGELGATEHNVIESNRRFRDDEFIIPRKLTEGKSAVRVRVQFTPVETPLFAGHPLPELAWSEMRYTAYCWVMPKWGNAEVRSQESE